MDAASARGRDLGARSARFLRVAGREARAFAKLASLLPRDWAESLPVTAQAGDDVVVLVHGTLATAGAFRPLRTRLAELPRTHTAGFTFAPSCGVEGVAVVLAQVMARLPPGVRVHLVGHSLGGLAIRWFVQETDGDPRVVQTISVAAPFSGARGARLFPGPAGRDMQRGSRALRRLAVTAAIPGIPHLSIFGGADTAVSPDTTFGAGERLVVPDAGHNALLFDDGVAAAIRQRVVLARVGGG